MSEKESFLEILQRIEELKEKYEEDSGLIRSFLAAIDENLYEYNQKIIQLEKKHASLSHP